MFFTSETFAAEEEFAIPAPSMFVSDVLGTGFFGSSVFFSSLSLSSFSVGSLFSSLLGFVGTLLTDGERKTQYAYL